VQRLADLRSELQEWKVTVNDDDDNNSIQFLFISAQT
jgi:hypothetical protein